MESMTINMEKVVSCINSFAGRMMKVDKIPLTQNATISPLSIWTALCMTINGADGDTRREMLNAVMPELPDSEEFRVAFQLLMKQVADERMLAANAVFVAPEVKIRDDFKQVMAACYGAAARVLPPSPQDACKEVNTFVQDMTKGEIRDMVDFRSMEEMRLMLVNAVYFKSMWATAFDKGDTKVAPFSMLDQKGTIDVRMMSVSGSFRVMRNEAVQIIEIPYDGNRFVMNIAMPAQNTMEAWKQMTKGDIRFPNMAGTPMSQIRLAMPRFAMNFKNNLVPHLQEMGIKMAFTQKADFSRMCEGGVNVSAVMHNAMVEVDEDGTTAGAGTISTMVSSVMGRMDEFRVDRPFVYCIKHAETNVVMFVGQMVDPSPVTTAM